MIGKRDDSGGEGIKTEKVPSLQPTSTKGKREEMVVTGEGKVNGWRMEEEEETIDLPLTTEYKIGGSGLPSIDIRDKDKAGSS